MNKETMKELDSAGWPAFGLGFGRWTRIARSGRVLAGGQVLRTPELLAHAGQRVFVTLAGAVYSSSLDWIGGAAPREETQPSSAAAQ